MLLRVGIGAMAVVQAAFYLPRGGSWSFASLFCCLLLVASGVCLLIGFLTPIAAVVIGIAAVGSAISLIPAPARNLFDAKIACYEVAVTAAAMALLGPGAFSLDAHLFGRREIVIPAPTRKPKT